MNMDPGGPMFGSGGYYGDSGPPRGPFGYDPRGPYGMGPGGPFGAWPGCGCSSVLIILAGLFIYLIQLDRKISRLEKNR